MSANLMLQLPSVYELIPKSQYECQERHITQERGIYTHTKVNIVEQSRESLESYTNQNLPTDSIPGEKTPGFANNLHPAHQFTHTPNTIQSKINQTINSQSEQSNHNSPRQTSHSINIVPNQPYTTIIPQINNSVDIHANTTPQVNNSANIQQSNITPQSNQSSQVKIGGQNQLSQSNPSPTFVKTPQNHPNHKTSPSTSGQDYFSLKRQSITSLSSISPMDKLRSKQEDDDVGKRIESRSSMGDIYKSNESRSSISETTRLPSLPSIIQSSRSNSYGNIHLPPVHFQGQQAPQVQQVQYQHQYQPQHQHQHQHQHHQQQQQQQRSHSVPSFSHSQPPPPHPVTSSSSQQHVPQLPQSHSVQPPPPQQQQQLPPQQHLHSQHHHGPPPHPVQPIPHPYMPMPMVQQQLGPPPHIIPQAAMQMYAGPPQGPGGPPAPGPPPSQYQMMNTPSGPVYYYPSMYTPEYIYPQYFSGMNYDENQMLINKRRIIKRRTRTGCLTCRKRRIKCDERKPGCFNCERSKKVCLGYENLINKANRRKKDTSLDLKDDDEDDEEDDKSDSETEGDKEKISG